MHHQRWHMDKRQARGASTIPPALIPLLLLYQNNSLDENNLVWLISSDQSLWFLLKQFSDLSS
jgi:hypothetical protein